MMRYLRHALALSVALGFHSFAVAQTYKDSAGTKVDGEVPLIGCSANGNCAGPVSNSNPMPVTVTSGGGGGSTDGSTFTPGSSTDVPVGCAYFASITQLSNGTQGVVACSPNREQYFDVLTTSTLYQAMTSGVGTNGSAYASSSGLMVGGYDGADFRFMKVDSNGNVGVSAITYSHASVTSLGTSLVVKASAGSLAAFNCTGVAGGAAGYCIAYNGTAAPSTGALTGSLVLDACYFDTTAKGCNLSHLPNSIAMSTGIVILVTSATTPFTYTTGTDTAYIEADYQ